MTNKLTAFTMGLVVLASVFLTPQSADASYQDVTSTHRTFEEINYLRQGDLTTSTSSTHFYPDNAMTREQAAAMIGKALQFSGTDTSTRFTDVSTSNTYAGYISEAAKRGIINGYSNGNGTYSFKPQQTLKRGEMALMIARAFGYPSSTTTQAGKELMARGISAGIGGNDFGSYLLMKRGDFAIFLARAVNGDFRTTALTTATKMYVNVGATDSLNFRHGPNTKYSVVKKFYRGYPVTVYYSIGDWVFARADNSSGFFHKSYLSSNQPSTSTVKPPEQGEKTFSQLKVIIDAGHGGTDPGASGYGYREKDVVLDISLRMKKYFDQVPYQALYTRETDKFIELSDRAKFAGRNDGDIFVSIHANSFNGSASGIENYYYAANANVAQSRALATYVHKRMIAAWGLTDRGVQDGNFHVLRENSVPAILSEVGFIDSSKDNPYIASTTRREQMAKAIFLGTLDYFYHYEGFTEASSYYSRFSASPSPRYH